MCGDSGSRGAPMGVGGGSMFPFSFGAFPTLLQSRTRGRASPPRLTCWCAPAQFCPIFPLGPQTLEEVRGRLSKPHCDLHPLIPVLVVSWVSNPRTSQVWVRRREPRPEEPAVSARAVCGPRSPEPCGQEDGAS